MKRIILALCLAFVASTVVADQSGRLRIQEIQQEVGGELLITWVDETENYTGDCPRPLSQRRMLFDHVSERVFTHSQFFADSSIYSSDMFAFDVSAKTCTHLLGNGDDQLTGSADFPESTAGGWQNGTACTPDCPSTRHPDFMQAFDTLRNEYFQYSGLTFGNNEKPPAGTAANCANYTQCQGNFWNDAWFLTLPSNPPLTYIWSHNTNVNSDIGFGASGGLWGATMVYVPTIDLFWMFGGNQDNTYVLCRTATMSSEQTAAGCVTQDQWALAQATAHANMNSQVQLKNAMWDPITGKVLVFWWGDVSTETTMKVFSYTLSTQTWDELPITGDIPTNQSGGTHSEQLISRVCAGPNTGLFHYHRTSHSSAGGVGQAADFLFDSSTNIWTQITAIGTGPDNYTFGTCDPTVGTHGTIIMHESRPGGLHKIWHGTFSTPS